MIQNVVKVSVIDHKNSPGFEQTVKVGNSLSLLLLTPTKRAKLSPFLLGIPVKFSFKNSPDIYQVSVLVGERILVGISAKY